MTKIFTVCNVENGIPYVVLLFGKTGLSIKGDIFRIFCESDHYHNWRSRLKTSGKNRITVIYKEK